MQKEQPLADAPEWSGAELIGPGSALMDPVRQNAAHVMQREV